MRAGREFKDGRRIHEVDLKDALCNPAKGEIVSKAIKCATFLELFANRSWTCANALKPQRDVTASPLLSAR